MPVTLNPNMPSNSSAGRLANVTAQMQSANRHCGDGDRYLDYSELAKSGMSSVWANTMKTYNQIEQYKEVNNIVPQRITAQHLYLSNVITDLEKLKQNVLRSGGPNNTNLDLNQMAQTTLRNLMNTFNTADATGTYIFSSFDQTQPPINVDISNVANAIWDSASVTAWPMTPANPTFVYDPDTMLNTSYTEDTAYSSLVALSPSVQVEQNVSITSDAIRNAIGALQILAFSGWPTPNGDNQEQSQAVSLLGTAIQQMIDLRTEVDMRQKQIVPVAEELDGLLEGVTDIYNGIFKMSDVEKLTMIPELQDKYQTLLALLGGFQKLPTLADYMRW